MSTPSSHSLRRGVSLVETMVVITIFLVLSTMVTVSFRSTQMQNDLRDARSLIVSHSEALRSDARAGLVRGAGVPRAYRIVFEPGAAFISEATDADGCGVLAGELIYSTIQLPKGIRVDPALPARVAVAFYVPDGQMVINPGCPAGHVCAAPCSASDVAASNVNVAIPLVHERGQQGSVSFDMVRGVVE